MFKISTWSTKEKLITAAVIFWLVLSRFLVDSLLVGLSDVEHVLLGVLSAAAFTVLLLTSLGEKSFSLKSIQPVFAVLCIIVTALIPLSRGYVSRESFYSLLVSAVMIMCAKKWYLTPVISVVSVITSFQLFTQAYLGDIALLCVPSAVCVSLVYASKELEDKEKEKSKRIIGFAAYILFTLISIAAMLNVYIKTGFYAQFLSPDMLITTVLAFVAALILVALAVYAVINKRPVEAVGYVMLAVCIVLCTFLMTKLAAVSVSAVYMVLVVLTSEGMTADDLFRGIMEKKSNSKKSNGKVKKAK